MLTVLKSSFLFAEFAPGTAERHLRDPEKRRDVFAADCPVQAGVFPQKPFIFLLRGVLVQHFFDGDMVPQGVRQKRLV